MNRYVFDDLERANIEIERLRGFMLTLAASKRAALNVYSIELILDELYRSMKESYRDNLEYDPTGYPFHE